MNWQFREGKKKVHEIALEISYFYAEFTLVFHIVFQFDDTQDDVSLNRKEEVMS